MKIDYLNIHVPKGVELAVVGDIHECESQFNSLVEQINPSPKRWIVSVGDIYDKGDGREAAERITRQFQKWNSQEYGYVARGNHELKNIKAGKRSRNCSPELEWLDQQPLVLSFVFANKTRVTVLHGGVNPKHKWKDLYGDTDVCYIRNLDIAGQMIKLERVPVEGSSEVEFRPSQPNGKSWHNFYDGRFGYIVAGHEPQKDGIAKFYNYSCNIDTACYCTGILTAQVLNENGRTKLLSATGPARRPL